MKLRSIEIDRFRAIESLGLSFDDALGKIRPITVLAGPNGCGKTSVLFAIVQTLRGVMGYRTDDVPQPSDLDMHRKSGGSKLSKAPPHIAVRLRLEFEEPERLAIPQVLKDTEQPEETDEETNGKSEKRTIPTAKDIPNGVVEVEWRFPPERRYDGSSWPTWRLRKIEPHAALMWFQGRKRAVRGWIENRLTEPDLIYKVGGITLFPQDRNLTTRVLGGGSPDRFAFGQRGAPDSHPETNDYSTGLSPQQKPIWGILEYLSGRSKFRRNESIKEEFDLEKKIQEVFNKVCAPKEYLGFLYHENEPVGAPYFRDGASEYPLNLAASGEQVIIEYITRLIYPSPLNYSLVLIDEPEIHLHPGWIRQLYRSLPQIGIGNQYILTTHSQELRALAAEDGALIDLGNLLA